MKLRWFYLCAAILPTTLLEACYSTKSVDTTAAMLMPDTVAKTVLSKYLGEDWVKNPYATKGALCSNPQVPIKISDVKTVIFNTFNNKAYIEFASVNLIRGGLAGQINCNWLEMSVAVRNEADAFEIANALVSLGSSSITLKTIFMAPYGL